MFTGAKPVRTKINAGARVSSGGDRAYFYSISHPAWRMYLKVRKDGLCLIQLTNPRLLFSRALLAQRNFVFVRRTPVKVPDECIGFGLHAVPSTLCLCVLSHRELSGESLRREGRHP